MSNFFLKRRMFAFLLCLIVLVTMMGVTVKDRPNPTWPERVVRDSFAFAQGLVYKPAIAVAGFFEGLRDIYQAHEENQLLKQKLEQLNQLTAELNEAKLQNEQFREMLDAKDSKLSDYELMVAEVVARSPDRWNHTLIIDKGNQDGVKPNMAVITPKGYIGRIQSVSNHSAQVELVTDIEQGNHIGAVAQANEPVYGVVEGYDQKNNLLIMRKIPLQAEIEPNQLVITSGLGGTIPRGLVLGEVISVKTDDQYLTKDAYIKPSANFNQLERVFVVERSYVPLDEISFPDYPPGAFEPEEEDEGGSAS